MTEITKEFRKVVTTYRVDRACEKCEDGRMRSTGIVFDMYPPQFPHACNKCGAGDTFEVRYPYVEHKAED